MTEFKQTRLTWLALSLVCVLSCCYGQEYEGTLFAAVLPPYDIITTTEIVVSSKQTVQVFISYDGLEDTFAVGENSQASYTIPEDMRHSGANTIEDKVIYISAATPVHAFVACMGNPVARIPPATQLRPYDDSKTHTYRLAGAPGVPCDDGTGPLYMYMVAAFKDDTEVTVTLEDGSTYEEFTLQEGEVSHHSISEDVLVGASIRANDPVSVYHGLGCALFGGETASVDAQYMMDSVPSMSEIGRRYQSFPMMYGQESEGYVIRVVATANDTRVNSPQVPLLQVLQDGEMLEIWTNVEVEVDANDAIEIVCSQLCLVAEYAIPSTVAGGPHNRQVGGFMVHLTATSFHTDNILVTVPSRVVTGSTHAILVINVDKYPIMGSLFFDDEDISEDTEIWEEIGNDMATHTREVDYGTYTLESTNPNYRFAAYIYTQDQSGLKVQSMGMSIGYTYSFEDPVPPPAYLVNMGGLCSNVLEEPIGPECALHLSSSLQTRSEEMMNDMNGILHTDICPEREDGDIVIESVQAFVSAVEGTNDGSASLIFYLSAISDLRIVDVYECADKVADYIKPFDTWGRPIIPPDEICTVAFVGDEFDDNRDGDDWDCAAVAGSESEKVKWMFDIEHNHPLYSLEVYDNFTVADDETLSFECETSYRQNWHNEVGEMNLELVQMMADGSMCGQFPIGGFFEISIYTSSFANLGQSGIIGARWVLQINDNELTFKQVYLCAAEMFDYMEPHDNWRWGPIIPYPPGCEVLVYEERRTMKHGGEKWEC